MEFLVVTFEADRGVIVNSGTGAWRTNQLLMLQAGTYIIALAGVMLQSRARDVGFVSFES